MHDDHAHDQHSTHGHDDDHGHGAAHGHGGAIEPLKFNWFGIALVALAIACAATVGWWASNNKPSVSPGAAPVGAVVTMPDSARNLPSPFLTAKLASRESVSVGTRI